MDLVRAVHQEAAELDPRWWRAFEGPAAHARALALTYAAALDNEQLIASAWSEAGTGGELHGVALAMVERHAGDRLVLGINLHGSVLLGRSRAFWTRAGVDRRAIVQRLLKGLLATARERGIQRAVVSYCPAEDVEVIAVAEELGARRLDAPADQVLRLAQGSTFETYLSGLRSKRRNDLVRDLRRAPEAGAVITRECPATAATLARVWPLQQDTYARKESKLLARGNLLAAYAERADPTAISVFTCVRGDALLGFLMAERVARDTSRFAYVGHVPEPGLQVYAAMVAEYLRHEIGDGVSTFLMGTTGEAYKRRLGCAAVPCLNLFFNV